MKENFETESIQEMEEKHDKQAHTVYVGILILLCFLFVGGFIYGINAVLALEGQINMSEDKILNTDIQVPETNEDVCKIIDLAFDKAYDEKPKLTTSDVFIINEDTIETSFDESFVDSFKFIKDKICESLSQSNFTPVETKFFDSLDGKLKKPNITPNDIESFEVNYKSYACRCCNNPSDKKLKVCDICGRDIEYREIFNDTYEIVVTLKNNEDVFNRNFSVQSNETINKAIDGKYENFFKLNTAPSWDYNKLSVKFHVSRSTQRLTYVEFIKEFDVAVNMTGVNEFASLNTSDFAFKAANVDVYTLTWPEIIFNAGVLEVEPKNSNTNIIAKLVCDNPVDYEIKWESSNPEICEVDQEGYLKSGKHCTEEECIITGSFEFGGNTYSQTCKVLVREPVSGVKLKDRKETMKVGETFQLEAKVSPKDATVSTVKWYTTNDAVAKVDEDGLITAVGKGEANVYVVTDDNAYKSTCKVTVE